MTPVLQCPECGQKHPLTGVPESGAFACEGCGRVLQVPESVGQRAAAAGAAGEASAREPVSPRPSKRPGSARPTVRPVPVATAVVSPNESSDARRARTMPELDNDALRSLSHDSKRIGRGGVRLGTVPWWMRFILWVIGIPLGFIVVFAAARAFSLFTSNQLSDLFLANNAGRFWPAARLLPFVALVTAGFVQGGVYVLALWRGRRTGVGMSPTRSRRP